MYDGLSSCGEHVMEGTAMARQTGVGGVCVDSEIKAGAGGQIRGTAIVLTSP